MKRLFIGISAVAALSFSPPTLAQQKTEAPIPPPPSISQVAPSTQQPTPYAQQRLPQIEMPDSPAAARQATTEAAGPTRARRPHRKRSVGATHFDRSATNAFTHQLNRQVLESLQPGGEALPVENPPSPSRAYPPQ